MLRIFTKKYLNSLLEQIAQLQGELVGIYGQNFYKAQPCQLCSKNRGLTEHHLIPRKKRLQKAQLISMETGEPLPQTLLEVRQRKVIATSFAVHSLAKNKNEMNVRLCRLEIREYAACLREENVDMANDGICGELLSSNCSDIYPM